MREHQTQKKPGELTRDLREIDVEIEKIEAEKRAAETRRTIEARTQGGERQRQTKDLLRETRCEVRTASVCAHWGPQGPCTACLARERCA